MFSLRLCFAVGFVLALLSWSSEGAQATVIYVDASATGPVHNGSSWCSGYTRLDSALTVAVNGDTIRVGDGTYVPDPTGLADPRYATFRLKTGVAVMGGYAGCAAPDPDERDFSLHETILSGDLNGDDQLGGSCSRGFSDCCTPHSAPGCDTPSCQQWVCSNTPGPECCSVEWGADCAAFARSICSINCNDQPNCENSYRVVTTSGCDGTALLEGFTVTSGNALPRLTYQISPASGGGLFSDAGSPTLSHCRFVDNFALWFGGGMAVINGSNPVVSDCEFVGNRTGMGRPESPYPGGSALGGAVYVEAGGITLERCVLRANTSPAGGGLATYSALDITVIDCTFQENQAVHDPETYIRSGGAIEFHGGNLQVRGSKFLLRAYPKNSPEHWKQIQARQR